jgi:hypothetical protein
MPVLIHFSNGKKLAVEQKLQEVGPQLAAEGGGHFTHEQRPVFVLASAVTYVEEYDPDKGPLFAAV